MFWWRAELDAEGAITKIEQVEQRAKGAGHVIYVHAVDKTAACDSVKQWYERRRAQQRNAVKRRQARLRTEGKCGLCAKPCAPSSLTRCRSCLDSQKVRDRLKRQGVLMPPVKAPALTPEQHYARAREYARTYDRLEMSLTKVLGKFDELEARPYSRFRLWLIDEINRRKEPRQPDQPQAAE